MGLYKNKENFLSKKIKKITLRDKCRLERGTKKNEMQINPLYSRVSVRVIWRAKISYILISIFLTCFTNAMFTANLHMKCSDIHVADRHDTSFSSLSTNSSGIIKPASSDFRWLWDYIKTALRCVHHVLVHDTNRGKQVVYNKYQLSLL